MDWIYICVSIYGLSGHVDSAAAERVKLPVSGITGALLDRIKSVGPHFIRPIASEPQRNA